MIIFPPEIEPSKPYSSNTSNRSPNVEEVVIPLVANGKYEATLGVYRISSEELSTLVIPRSDKVVDLVATTVLYIIVVEVTFSAIVAALLRVCTPRASITAPSA